MPKTKKTPRKGRGQGENGTGPSRVPKVGKGQGKGTVLVVPGRSDSGRKHGGLSQGTGRVIITAAVTAARAAQSTKGNSNLLLDLGSDPWSFGGEDDLNGKTKKGVTSKTVGKSPRPPIAMKAPRNKSDQVLLKNHTNTDLVLSLYMKSEDIKKVLTSYCEN